MLGLLPSKRRLTTKRGVKPGKHRLIVLLAAAVPRRILGHGRDVSYLGRLSLNPWLRRPNDFYPVFWPIRDA